MYKEEPWKFNWDVSFSYNNLILNLAQNGFSWSLTGSNFPTQDYLNAIKMAVLWVNAYIIWGGTLVFWRSVCKFMVINNA